MTLDWRPAGVLAGRLEFDARAPGESVHPEVAEALVGEAQLLAGIETPALTPQPFAVEQMGPREIHAIAARPLLPDSIRAANAPLPPSANATARAAAAAGDERLSSCMESATQRLR